MLRSSEISTVASGTPTDPFPDVTESPGNGVTAEQLSMLFTRYDKAAFLAERKRVLEVACGPGLGLGYLLRRARLVVGGDYSRALLRAAGEHYRGRVPLVQLDAGALPFADGTFDLVLLYEAIYYLARPYQFVREARRVLCPGGTLLMCTANKDRPGFVSSPHTHRYFSAGELRQLIASEGFDVEIFGAFPTSEASVKGKLLSLARRLVVGLNLVPRTLKGRERLKRLAYGRLHPLMPEVEEGAAPSEPLVPISASEDDSSFKVLYAVAHVA